MTHDYAAFAVPTRSGRQLVMEVSFLPGSVPDDWTCQLLETAASLAAIAFEVERGAPNTSATLSAHRGDVGPLIGASEVMQALRERLERVASTDFTILIEGDSGVGKELVARQIHACSRRRQGPFVAINCAALVETLIEAELFGIEERTATGVRGRRGKFEHADGGTLFLDEVSDLSLSAQAKLLRAIQDLTVERVGGTGRPARGRSHCRGDQPQPRGSRRARPVPRGPVLPLERRGGAGAAAAAAEVGHSGADPGTS